MVNLTIDGRPAQVPEGTTILEAARQADIHIPHLCYLKGINEIAACRVCCVEVEGERAMVTACNNPVQEGMAVHTNSPRARSTRRINVELILSQHDCKCATCVRSGNCQLQEIANDLGILELPFEIQLPQGLRKAWTTTFPLFHDYNKCIKCMRCIQVCDKIQSLSIWDVAGTGSRTTIDVSNNRVIKDSDCALCGQCITHCPTGGLRERDDTQRAFAALADPDKITVVQVAPAVRTAWGEAFGLPREQATMGRMAAALRRLGFRYRPGLELRSEGMRKVFALMLPVMVSTWVQPINLTINSKFGSRLYEGAGVSAIEFSTNLYLVIAGVFVLSVTNVIFPKLSRLTGREQEGEFRETLRTTLHGCLFFVLPMSAGLMVLSRPLISFIYGGGAFDDFSVSITSQGLFWVSLGMTGYAVQNILSRAYFARQKGKVPLAAGAASILVNVLLCMALAQRMGVAGLALSSAVSSTVYALLLDIPLELRGEGVLSRSFLLDLGKMALATALMAVGAWAVAGLIEGLLPGKAGELLTLGASAAAGVAVYFPAAVLLRLDEGQLALKMVKRVWKRG